MAKYLDNVVFNSKTQGVQETLKVRDTEARAQIQTNANAIADVTVKEAQDRVNIANNAKEIESLHKDVERIDAKDGMQDLRLDAIEKLDEEQNTRLTNIEAVNEEQNSRLDEAEKDIIQLEDRMDTAEDDIDKLEDRVTTAEGNIQELDDRVTIAEDDIDTLETRADNVDKEIGDIKEKDAEQDAKLDDLDERVAASTYEAGEGIYFGQGVVHTSINVEDELLEQINQNTTDIKELRETKTELYRPNKTTGVRMNYPEVKLGDGLSITQRDGEWLLDTQSYTCNMTLKDRFVDIEPSASFATDIATYMNVVHYNDTTVSVPSFERTYAYGTPLMMRISQPSGRDYNSYSPCIISNGVGFRFPCVVTTFTRDLEDKPVKVTVTVPSSSSTKEELTTTVIYLTTSTDIEAINQKILDLTSRVTTLEGTVDEHESMIQSILSDVEELGTKVQTNTTNINNLTTRVTNNETNITKLQSDKLDKVYYSAQRVTTITNFGTGGNIWSIDTPCYVSVDSTTQNKPDGMRNGTYFMLRFGYKYDSTKQPTPDMYGNMYSVVLFPTDKLTTPESNLNSSGIWYGVYDSILNSGITIKWRQAATKDEYNLTSNMDVYVIPNGTYRTQYGNVNPVNGPEGLNIKAVYVLDFGIICEDTLGRHYYSSRVNKQWFRLGSPEPVYINATADTLSDLGNITLTDVDKVKELINTKYTYTDSIPQVYLKIKIGSKYSVIPMSYQARLVGDVEPYIEQDIVPVLTGLYMAEGYEGTVGGNPNVYLIRIFTRDPSTEPPLSQTPKITAELMQFGGGGSNDYYLPLALNAGFFSIANEVGYTTEMRKQLFTKICNEMTKDPYTGEFKAPHLYFVINVQKSKMTHQIIPAVLINEPSPDAGSSTMDLAYAYYRGGDNSFKLILLQSNSTYDSITVKQYDL